MSTRHYVIDTDKMCYAKEGIYTSLYHSYYSDTNSIMYNSDLYLINTIYIKERERVTPSTHGEKQTDYTKG